MNPEEFEKLTSSQKAVLALEIENRLAEEAKERQREAAKKTNNGRSKSDNSDAFGISKSDNSDAFGTEKNGKTSLYSRAEAARIVGVNDRYISLAKKIQRSAPELLDLIRGGHLTIPEAKRIAVIPGPQRAAIIDRIKTGEAKTAKEAIGQIIRKKGEKPPENFGVGWPRAMYKLWIFFNGLRDHGGIEMLSQRWSEEVKRSYLDQLRRVRERMTECIEYLEKELNK